MEGQAQNTEAPRRLPRQDEVIEDSDAPADQVRYGEQDESASRSEQLASNSERIDQKLDARYRTMRGFDDDEERIAPAYARRSDYSQRLQPRVLRNTGKPEVAYLIDHLGKRYVFPFEQLRSWEVCTFRVHFDQQQEAFWC